MESRPSSAHTHKINVSWGDCDPAKIVYTARLPWFALDAINGWWEAHLDGDGWFQMELDHTLTCHVWPEKLGETSITFRVDAEQNGKLCFSTRTVSVFTVADQFAKQTPPTEIKEIIERALPQRGMEAASA